MPGIRRIGHTKVDPRTRRSIAMLAQEADLVFGDGLSVDGSVTGVGGGSLITINLADPSGLIKTDGLAIDPKDSGGVAIDTDGLYIVLDTPAHGLHMSLGASGLSIDDDYVFNSGDSMSGNLNMSNNDILNAGPIVAMNEPTGFPNRTDSDLSFVSGTRTFTIAPAVSTFDIWQASTRYTISSSDDIIIPDTAGLHVIYYDGSTLSQVLNPSHSALDALMLNKILITLIYWNATDNAAYLIADERHGIIMSGKTHEWLHDNIGAVWREGLTASGYTLNTKSDVALQFDVSDGEFYDEDIEIEIEDGIATNQYEQVLQGDAEIPVLYRDDIDGTWKEQAASTLPYISAAGGANRLAYNKDDGDGTWSQVECGVGKFMAYTLVATNDWQYPIKMIQGNTEYVTKSAALEGANAETIAWGSFPSSELIILYRFIMQTGAYAGTKKAQIIEVTDFRSSGITGISATAQDHGTLSGLSDDDHAQYLLADGTRDLSGNWTIGTNSITLTAGTLTAEHITSTDDMNVADHLYIDAGGDILDISSGKIESGGSAISFVAANLTTTGTITTTATITTNELILTTASQDYLFTSRASTLALQSQTSGQAAIFELYNKDGDGTDATAIHLFSRGAPGDLSAYELVQLYKDASSFSIASSSNGAGTTRPIQIYTNTDTNQLVISTDGKVGIQDSTPSYTLDVNGIIRAVSGLIIPVGTGPVPSIEGALFLDSDAGANGTLKIYSNAAWRTVAVL